MAHRGRLNILSNVMGKPAAGDLPRIRRRRDQPGRRRRLGRRQIPPRHLVGPRVRRQQGPSVAAAQPVAPRSGRSGRARQGARGADDQGRRAGRHRAADPAPRRRRLRRPGRGVGMPRASPACPATAPAARSISSSTTRSASPPARSSRARRLIRRTSPRASRRRSSTSTATIPKRSPSAASWRSSSARRFNRDIVIDMWCYRRFGHNEGDEPSFTQPLMYAAIKKHPPISEIYGKRLIAEGVVDQAWIDAATKDYRRAPRGGVPGGGLLPAEQGRLVRGPLGGPRPSRRAGARPPQHRRPRSAKTSCDASARC